jgi:hypothetical protein
MIRDFRPQLEVRDLQGPLLRPWRIAYQRSATEVAQRLIGALGASAPKLSDLPPF